MNKRIIILMLLLGVIWGGVYLTPSKDNNDQGVPPDPDWPPFKTLQAKKVFLDSPGGEITLEKQNGEWFLRQPGEAPAMRADLNKVETLLRVLQSTPPTRRLGALKPQEAVNFGLDKPKISVNISEDNDWRIQLGAQNPTGEGLYALSSAEPEQVLLLDSKLEEMLSRPAEQYFDLRLVNVSAQNAAKIRLDCGEARWEVERDNATADDAAEPQYLFTWPERAVKHKVSAREVESYIHTLSSLRGERVTQPGAPGTPAVCTLTVGLGGQEEPVVIDIFPQGNAYEARSGWQPVSVELAKETVDKLAKTAFDMRERRVIPSDSGGDAGEYEKMTISMQGKGGATHAFQARKADMGWKSDPGGEEAPGLDMLLWRLGDLKYEAEPNVAAPQGAQETLVWALEGEKKRTVITFYRDESLPAHLCWMRIAKGEKNGAFYPVDTELLLELEAKIPRPEPGAEKTANETTTQTIPGAQ